MNIFESTESEVRSYCRNYPKIFSRAKMSTLYTEDGEAYIDFFDGAGALNYGHNNDYIKERVLRYLSEDRILHALDMYTEAKRDFLTVFKEKILEPRGLHYKVMCCGPTGTNAVEAALKLARKVKGRQNVIAFVGSFHGMTAGSLAVSSGLEMRAGAGQVLPNVTFMPYPYKNITFDTIDYLEMMLADDHSGIDKPAAVIVETVQAEGGIVVAPAEWLQRLRDVCDRYDMLLICDDIQVGCGRCGTFFSFERAGIVPDMVTLSKSISGYGFPMALMLAKPELDIWHPAEHNGTFRGFQLAFVGAKAAIEYREEHNLDKKVQEDGAYVENFVRTRLLPLHKDLLYRGIGLIHGIDFEAVPIPEAAKKTAKAAFERGLVIERSGRGDHVLKIMPALTISREELTRGLEIIEAAMREVLC